jgi:hypothetical protein
MNNQQILQQQNLQPGINPTEFQQKSSIPPQNIPQTNSTFDQEEINITEAGGGLDVPAGTHPIIIWGVISYPGKGFGVKANEVVNKKLIVVQFPTNLDSNSLPQVGWVYCTEAFGGKSNFHKYLKEIFGRSIGTNDPIRNQAGNLDPKKIYGTNALASVGNISKKQGEENMGIINFTPAVAGMQTYTINNNVPLPEYVTDLKNGKELQNNTAPNVPIAPVLPTTNISQPPVQQQTVVQPPVQQQTVVQPPVQQQKVTPQNTVGMFNNAINSNNITQ